MIAHDGTPLALLRPALVSAVLLRFEGIQPLPKGRPRATKSGRVYTPSKTRDYERLLAWMARAQMADRTPLEGDIAVSLVFKRRTKRRADVDNLTKAALDALNGIAYGDDCQVVSQSASVQYGCQTPGVYVALRAA